MSEQSKKVFADDFERIAKVKSNDKILIWDSESGTVMYATPGQINAMLGELADHAQRAETAASSAATSAQSASNSATVANSAKSAAQSSADEAELAYEELPDTEDITSEAVAANNARLRAIAKFIAKLLPLADLEDVNVRGAFNIFGPTNLVLVGEGAPSEAPDFVGQTYIDKTNKVRYTAFGDNAVSDWKS